MTHPAPSPAPDELVERAARRLCISNSECGLTGECTEETCSDWKSYIEDATTVIAAISPIIRNEQREIDAGIAEAEKLGEGMLANTSIWAVHEGTCNDIARAILAQKETP